MSNSLCSKSATALPQQKGMQHSKTTTNPSTSDVPAKFHLRDLDKYRGVPVSYLGGGWYRPVLPVRHYHGSIRPHPCVTRAEVWEAAAQFRQRYEQDEVAEGAASPLQHRPSVLDSIPEEAECTLPSLEHRPSILMSTPEEDIDMTVPEPEPRPEHDRQARPPPLIPEMMYRITQLRDHPGGEFRAIGDGKYVRDASRTGDWVTVPHQVATIEESIWRHHDT